MKTNLKERESKKTNKREKTKEKNVYVESKGSINKQTNETEVQ